MPVEPLETAIAEPGTSAKEKTGAALDVAWNVIVHNDPITTMTYVTMVFQKIFRFSREKAEKHMLEVHHAGRSIVWSGPREQAEFYVQQLHAFQLLATLEKPA